MEKKEFILNSPLVLEDGTRIESLALKEPTAGMVEMAEKDGKTGTGINIILIGLCADRHPNQIRNLSLKDYGPIVKWIEGFLPEGQ